MRRPDGIRGRRSADLRAFLWCELSHLWLVDERKRQIVEISPDALAPFRRANVIAAQRELALGRTAC